MPVKFKRFFLFTLYLLLCLLIIILQSSGLLTLQISTASVVLILPMIIYGGFYFGCFTGALIGFICGVMTDAVSSTTYFNTISFTVCGFVCGLVMMYLFNRNFSAACVLCPSVSFLYFFSKWLLIYAFKDPSCGFVLLNYTLPSFLYTATVGILMYYIFLPFFKRLPQAERK